MLKTIVVIPARGRSKGIPRKNVKVVCGKPLVAWSIEAARSARSVSDVYVSTEDDEIACVARQYGAKVIGRPKSLSGDEVSSESVLLHALDQIPEADLLVFMQCTSPLTCPEDVDAAVQTLIKEKADSCLAVSEFHSFVWERDADGCGVGVNHDKAIRLRRQDKDGQYLETGSLYVVKIHGFRQAKHRFFGETVFSVLSPGHYPELDVMEDMPVVEALLQKQLTSRALSGLPFVPEAVAFDFDGVFTDNKVYVDQHGMESVRCDRSDGWGIAQLKKSGVRIVVLSTEKNGVVQARCDKLGIECWQGLGEKKLERFLSWCREAGIDIKQTIFVGNDDNDGACLSASGFGVVPSDAYPEAIALADLVLSSPGGNGAVREVCEMVLKKRLLGRISGWFVSESVGFG